MYISIRQRTFRRAFPFAKISGSAKESETAPSPPPHQDQCSFAVGDKASLGNLNQYSGRLLYSSLFAKISSPTHAMIARPTPSRFAFIRGWWKSGVTFLSGSGVAQPPQSVKEPYANPFTTCRRGAVCTSAMVSGTSVLISRSSSGIFHWLAYHAGIAALTPDDGVHSTLVRSVFPEDTGPEGRPHHPDIRPCQGARQTASGETPCRGRRRWHDRMP